MLCQAQAGGLREQVLPPHWHEQPYQLPHIAEGSEFDFHAVRLDAGQLAEELKRWQHSLLWPGFGNCFNQARSAHRRPLRNMSQWHLALALAAGQVTGRIESTDGRTFLIKGDTFKKKERSVSYDTDAEGQVTETITMIDKFVPVINAIELTPGERLGQIVRIS